MAAEYNDEDADLFASIYSAEEKIPELSNGVTLRKSAGHADNGQIITHRPIEVWFILSSDDHALGLTTQARLYKRFVWSWADGRQGYSCGFHEDIS